jgi:hypothetical protein
MGGCFSYNSVDKLPVQSKFAHVYVFNDKTQLWDRARLEDLQKADCGKLRFITVPENPANM